MATAASRRARNSATIAFTAASASAVRVRAASAAYCAGVDALDVVCDCSAVIACETDRDATDQPIRNPVMAYALATPFTTTSWSRDTATSSTDGASAPE